jgi:Sap, sulfolipid-1-addressing protein
VNLQILPLAITMMAGPQIMSAIIFVTAERAVPISLAFVVGVAIATTLGVLIVYVLGNALDLDLGDPSDAGSSGAVVQYVLIALLVLAAVKNYVGRETVEPPKWLGRLQQAGPRQAFTTGLLVILLMPSDVIILLTSGPTWASRTRRSVKRCRSSAPPSWSRRSPCSPTCSSTGGR